MIMADKIIRLRKKNGWSQEELADKLDVSRQAVSKWEAAQSVPNLDKILQLSDLFGVTTDYLLKDEIEDEEFTDNDDVSSVKKITLEDANKYLDTVKTNSKKTALATFLCIISAIPMLALIAVSQIKSVGLSENVATAIGIGFLIVIVAGAVAIFIYVESINEPFEFIDKGEFSTEYGVKGMVTERKKEYKNEHTKDIIFGVIMCVISPIPLLIAAFWSIDFVMVLTVALLLFIVGIGVMKLVKTNSYWDAMLNLLSEEEFAEERKKENKLVDRLETIYWLVFTAVYLTWSFLTNDWGKTWIIWPVAGVLFAAYSEVIEMIVEKKKDNSEQ